MNFDFKLIDKAYQRAIKELDIHPILLDHNYTGKLKIIRLYSLLSQLLGDDIELMLHWIKTYNGHLQFIPRDEINSFESLDEILSYLDYFLFVA